ncbi:MAG: CpsD/CapB family tyrosine-protein kinase [Saccharofermentanales bacterium]
MTLNKLTINHFPGLEYAAAESLNTLWTNLSFSGSNMKTFAVTSCRPDEGKTFVVMNLARTIAGTGKKVLMIDADLRKSVIAGRYRISSTSGEMWGLVHYLTGHCTVEQMLYDTNIPNLNLILAGYEVINSFALLNTPNFPGLLKELAEDYDVVLIDTPPVGTIIDAALIARHCDGTALVVKYNTVSRKELADAKAQLEKVGGRVLGVVLNDVELNAYGMKKYYYKGYYKYSQQADRITVPYTAKRRSRKKK